jgi:hypothetical protein
VTVQGGRFCAEHPDAAEAEAKAEMEGADRHSIAPRRA